MKIAKLRKEYHHSIYSQLLVNMKPKKARIRYPNFADAANKPSIKIAWEIIENLNFSRDKIRKEKDIQNIEGGETQDSIGSQFEFITKTFLQSAFTLLQHLRPGDWRYSTEHSISEFAQYEHLADLGRLKDEIQRLDVDRTLSAMVERILGRDYIIKPDIVVGRQPVSDEEINKVQKVLGTEKEIAQRTPLRAANCGRSILHASISCKWTLRGDRGQNVRTEALNLIRTRKGPVPHIVAVTAEPLPGRIASLALGTGDIDCVYHIALPELEAAVVKHGSAYQNQTLSELIEGQRLRDISDMPFDLAT